MDVQIDNLEVSAGVNEEKKQVRNTNYQYDEVQLELKIERCVERVFRQMMSE